MGDKIQGDVGDDSRNASFGKGNQQTDQQVTLNINEPRERMVQPTLPSIARSLERLERMIDGDKDLDSDGLRIRVNKLSTQVRTLIILAVAEWIVLVGLVIFSLIQIAGK